MGVGPVTKPPVRCGTASVIGVTVKLPAAGGLKMTGVTARLRCDGVTVAYDGAQNVKVPELN
jgi:hypothetical protein